MSDRSPRLPRASAGRRPGLPGGSAAEQLGDGLRSAIPWPAGTVHGSGDGQRRTGPVPGGSARRAWCGRSWPSGNGHPAVQMPWGAIYVLQRSHFCIIALLSRVPGSEMTDIKMAECTRLFPSDPCRYDYARWQRGPVPCLVRLVPAGPGASSMPPQLGRWTRSWPITGWSQRCWQHGRSIAARFPVRAREPARAGGGAPGCQACRGEGRPGPLIGDRHVWVRS